MSYNDNIIWSISGEETGRINYSISTVNGNSYIELNYKVRQRGEEEWIPIKYKVSLETVGCHFGGERWFFRCSLYRNGQYCGRRVAFLYQAGEYFGCRNCADLTYESCNELKRFRGWPWRTLCQGMKADEILEKISRKHYAGKTTRKYRRYLKLGGEIERVEAVEELVRVLKGGKI